MLEDTSLLLILFLKNYILSISLFNHLLETREKDLVYWQKSSKSILETVTHTNGRFFIKESGFYYVFSQIKYDHDPDSANNTDARQSHVLLKISYRSGDQNKLLENTRTFSELRTPENNGTSYIGAVFKLEEDDEIMIKSTHTHKLSGEEHENYFGLYII